MPEAKPFIEVACPPVRLGGQGCYPRTTKLQEGISEKYPEIAPGQPEAMPRRRHAYVMRSIGQFAIFSVNDAADQPAITVNGPDRFVILLRGHPHIPDLRAYPARNQFALAKKDQSCPPGTAMISDDHQ